MSVDLPGRAVYVLDVEPDEGGGVTSILSLVVPRRAGHDVVLHDATLFHGAVSPAASRAREARVCELARLEAHLRGSSFLVGDPDRDRRSHELDVARRRIAHWDCEHIITPLGALLQERPGILVFRRSAGMPRFSALAAIREGIDLGLLPVGILRGLSCVPTWAESAEDLMGHLTSLALFGLPEVDPARSVLLLGADAPNEFLSTVATNVPDDDKRDALEAMPAELRSVAWLSLLREALVDEAVGIGMEVHAEATRADMERALSAGSYGATLFLVAHQDELGVHLWDAPVAIEEVNRAIHRPAAGAAYGAVDLAVCGADSPGNLASAFARRGSPVVLTRGAIGYQGRAMARLLGLIRLLREGCVASLPELHGRAWELEISA